METVRWAFLLCFGSIFFAISCAGIADSSLLEKEFAYFLLSISISMLGYGLDGWYDYE